MVKECSFHKLLFVVLLVLVQRKVSEGFVVAPSPTVKSYSTTCTQRSLGPEVLVPAAVILGGGALWLSGAEDRANQAKYDEWKAQSDARMAERARLAYIEPKEEWTEDELRVYDGNKDPDGPILIAADGVVYNVWKGRNFYGPGGEYAIFAGRDATRLLAKFRTEEEDEESLKKPLTVAERATLQGYVYTFREKYEPVGKLKGFDPKDTA
eukprot:CAMPEP_0178910340 /NCGR_PEP_ID=MMETSP0786-20121207/9043_1 /TAXON_ID=186022 /ORGANISM="Thalassionema frauenfeldii, Strain CCMP 1798" /LENGTH=209 /DNA_ID=CAMNT_0020582581 /DNA_START=96 /DNA_END=721 /DNA_ORIENTATION=+